MPELRATSRSMPVPTIGGSATSSGTACRCMLEPINARLASSCSRNGIKPAETPTIWLGATSMYCDLVGRHHLEVGPVAGDDRCRRRSCRSSTGVSAGATYASLSSSARSHTTSSVTLPLLTLRYGVTRKPYSSTPAVDRQAGDQTDVRTFRRLNRADAAVVRNVHVADFEARSLAIQTARAEGRQAAARA